MSYQPTDQDLLSRLSADPAAFEVFYRRHVDRVIGFTARRVRDPADVADVVAATFLAVLTAARSYDPGRGEPTAWLLGIARRLIVNAHRRGARELAAMTRIAGHRLIDASDIERLEERIDAARSSEVALDALSRLRPRAQEVILLVSVDGLSPGEAAQVLGISAAACRVRLSRARRALGKAIDAANADAAPQPARNANPAPAPARNASPAPAPARNSSLERTSGDYRYAR